MTADLQRTEPRSLTCASCGATFSCTGDADCWCGAEPYRLPMPTTMPARDATADCLCPHCLRLKAATARTV